MSEKEDRSTSGSALLSIQKQSKLLAWMDDDKKVRPGEGVSMAEALALIRVTYPEAEPAEDSKRQVLIHYEPHKSVWASATCGAKENPQGGSWDVSKVTCLKCLDIMFDRFLRRITELKPDD